MFVRSDGAYSGGLSWHCRFSDCFRIFVGVGHCPDGANYRSMLLARLDFAAEWLD
jgi:hypothetical protein